MEKWFKHIEEAVGYLTSLRDSDVSDISEEEISKISPDENECISEEEDIDNNFCV